jgi:hypothetical protein
LTGLKIVFLRTGMLRLAAAWLLRPIAEMKGMRTRQALQFMRYMQNWRLMLRENSDSHPNKMLHEHSDEENFWPLFGRREVDRQFSIAGNFNLSRE